MKRRILAFLMVIVLAFSLGGCADGNIGIKNAVKAYFTDLKNGQVYFNVGYNNVEVYKRETPSYDGKYFDKNKSKLAPVVKKNLEAISYEIKEVIIDKYNTDKATVKIDVTYVNARELLTNYFDTVSKKAEEMYSEEEEIGETYEKINQMVIDEFNKLDLEKMPTITENLLISCYKKADEGIAKRWYVMETEVTQKIFTLNSVDVFSNVNSLLNGNLESILPQEKPYVNPNYNDQEEKDDTFDNTYDEDTSDDRDSSNIKSIGDYEIEYLKHEIINTEEFGKGKTSIILVYYNFKNNSDIQQPFLAVIQPSAYQNGNSLEQNFSAFADIEEYNNSITYVEPGEKIKVCVAFTLEDTSSNVKLELREFFNADSSVITNNLKLDSNKIPT